MFYDVFTKLCDERGIAPTQVAKALGLKRSTISMWKTDGVTPKVSNILALADYFQVNPAYLTSGDESKRSPLSAFDEATQKMFNEADSFSRNVESVKLLQKKVVDNLDEIPTGMTEQDAKDIALFIQFLSYRHQKKDGDPNAK